MEFCREGDDIECNSTVWEWYELSEMSPCACESHLRCYVRFLFHIREARMLSPPCSCNFRHANTTSREELLAFFEEAPYLMCISSAQWTTSATPAAPTVHYKLCPRPILRPSRRSWVPGSRLIDRLIPCTRIYVSRTLSIWVEGSLFNDLELLYYTK